MPDMPKFVKPPPELVARFETVLDRVASPETTRRPMFGHPCAWVAGNMATGLFASSWWVRLAPERLAGLFASGEGRRFEVMPGRPMKGFVAIPPGVVADDEAIGAWVEKGLAIAGAMPPKEPGARKKKA
jgi:hypothetical protein